MTPAHYYNEHDENASAWLRVLSLLNHIPYGEVDGRDVQAVTPADLANRTQCHFFAGIGGWPYALHLAGWPAGRSVWTASLPCQPFSNAGRRRGTDDERHLWPHFRDLVEQCRPSVIFGEQVASKLALGGSTYVSPKKSVKHLLDQAGRNAEEEPHRSWFATVQADLEDLGYVVAASDLPAAGVGAPHIRQRLYWCAVRQQGELLRADLGGVPEVVEGRFGVNGMAYLETGRRGQVHSVTRGRGEGSGAQRGERFEHGGGAGGVAYSSSTGLEVECKQSAREKCAPVERGGAAGGVAYGNRERFEEREERNIRTFESGQQAPLRNDALRCSSVARLPDAESTRREQRWASQLAASAGLSHRREQEHWDDVIYLPCADGKARPIKPGIEPLVDGVPSPLGHGGCDHAPLETLDLNTKEARVTRLRGYGNAIVPPLAAVFIRSVMEILDA